MAEDRNTLQLISDITEFNDLHEYMQDEHLDKALSIVVKLLMNPDVPSAKAPMLIMELQAMSTKFAVMSSVYSTIAKDKAGTVNNNKKNVYYSVKESIDKLGRHCLKFHYKHWSFGRRYIWIHKQLYNNRKRFI